MCNKVVRLCPPTVPSSHIFPEAGPWNLVKVALLGRTSTSPGAFLDSEQGIYNKALQLGRSNMKLKYGASWDLCTLVLDPQPPCTSCLAFQPSSVGYSHFHTSCCHSSCPAWGRKAGGWLGCSDPTDHPLLLTLSCSFNPVSEHLMKVATTLSASSQYKLWGVKKMGYFRLSPEILKASGGDLAKFCICSYTL